MELAVLLKAVPRSETVRYEPTLLTLAREGAELVLNPFDQRALRVALELRRPGETVTVVSLGPGAAGPVLREARAVGADRAVHLCDEAFAGSDVLATSLLLAAALRPLRPGLVLAGARSTDGDTGLVGPEVAARLGVPVVSSARAVRRRPAPGPVEVDVDTADGWATVEVDPPAVITVGEKIAKPLPVEPDAYARVGAAGVEAVGAASLGVPTTEVGSFGSPTTVEEVWPAAPTRHGQVFGSGTVADRVGAALAALGPLLRRPSSAPPPLPWPPELDPHREVIVLCTGPLGEVDPESLGVVTQLRRALPAQMVTVAAYGPVPDEASRRRLEAAGALAGYLLATDGRPCDSADVARGLSSLLDHRPRASAVVCLDGPFGREVAGQLAAGRSLGAVADAIDVRAVPEGGLEWSKPSFGGATLAAVRCRSTPVVATVLPGLSAPSADGRSRDPVAWTSLAPPAPRGRVRRRAEHLEPTATPAADGADVVVAVGAGIGGPEGIARLLPAVRRWGAALTATRRVVDAGWMPVRSQVGLTGRAYAPRLAVLLAVRGAENHMVGWARAGAIVAVNQDAGAPVFRQADVGIVGTVDAVVPELVEPLARALDRPPAD
ncbi:MAG TPA: FAD-binding protein [Thermoplasmata archaeon]|nr:FAD-binding protein [Thermoplasmata archaeon]